MLATAQQEKEDLTQSPGTEINTFLHMAAPVCLTLTDTHTFGYSISVDRAQENALHVTGVNPKHTEQYIVQKKLNAKQ